MEVICLECGIREWRNDNYVGRDACKRFVCSGCGESISLAPSGVIANEGVLWDEPSG